MLPQDDTYGSLGQLVQGSTVRVIDTRSAGQRAHAPLGSSPDAAVTASGCDVCEPNEAGRGTYAQLEIVAESSKDSKDDAATAQPTYSRRAALLGCIVTVTSGHRSGCLCGCIGKGFDKTPPRLRPVMVDDHFLESVQMELFSWFPRDMEELLDALRASVTRDATTPLGTAGRSAAAVAGGARRAISQWVARATTAMPPPPLPLDAQQLNSAVAAPVHVHLLTVDEVQKETLTSTSPAGEMQQQVSIPSAPTASSACICVETFGALPGASRVEGLVLDGGSGSRPAVPSSMDSGAAMEAPLLNMLKFSTSQGAELGAVSAAQTPVNALLEDTKQVPGAEAAESAILMEQAPPESTDSTPSPVVFANPNHNAAGAATSLHSPLIPSVGLCIDGASDEEGLA